MAPRKLEVEGLGRPHRPDNSLTRWLPWVLVAFCLLLATLSFWFEARSGYFFLDQSPTLILFALPLFGVSAVIGALIVSRRAGHPVGWLMLLYGVAGAVDNFAFGYVALGTTTQATGWPGTDLMLIWLSWGSQTVVVLLIALLLLLFPSGRLLSARWRPVAWTVIVVSVLSIALAALKPGPVQFAAAFSNPIGVDAAAWALLQPFRPVIQVLSVLCLAAAGLSLILRLRRAGSVERQQIKFLILPGIFFPLALISYWAGLSILPAIFTYALFLSVPLSIGIAIFRYRLYDIDIIIRRTLVYSLLTAVLAVVYLGSVIALQALFHSLTGQESPLAIVMSTLLIAALFAPLRRGLQGFIDRRFYRRKYDAARTLAAFAATARDEVDLQRLTAELLRVVDETMQPASVSLWLRES